MVRSEANNDKFKDILRRLDQAIARAPPSGLTTRWYQAHEEVKKLAWAEEEEVVWHVKGTPQMRGIFRDLSEAEERDVARVKALIRVTEIPSVCLFIRR